MLTDKIWRYAFALAALVFSGYVVLEALGRDTTQLFVWIASTGSLVVNGLIYSKQQQHSAKLDETATKVDKVNEQVNGRMTQLIEKKTLPTEAINGTNGTPGSA